MYVFQSESKSTLIHHKEWNIRTSIACTRFIFLLHLPFHLIYIKTISLNKWNQPRLAVSAGICCKYTSRHWVNFYAPPWKAPPKWMLCSMRYILHICLIRNSYTGWSTTNECAVLYTYHIQYWERCVTSSFDLLYISAITYRIVCAFATIGVGNNIIKEPFWNIYLY